MNKWLKVLALEAANSGAGRTAKLMIDGPIGGYNWFDESGTTAAQFIRQVDSMDLGEGDAIHIDLNSPGGIVSDGIAITNYLRNHAATVRINVIGQAGSIASVIAMAADPGNLHMGIGTTLFVHDPAALLQGAYQSDELRRYASTLDKVRDSAASIYAARNATLSREEILELMAGSTTMTAEEAVQFGFADTMDADLKAVACENIDEVLAKVNDEIVDADPADAGNPDPEALQAQLAESQEALKTAQEEIARIQAAAGSDPAPTNEEPPADDPQAEMLQIMRACNDAGVPLLAAKFAGDGLKFAQVKERLAASGSIRDICMAAKLPDRANTYIEAGMSVDEVRKELFSVLVARDVHIDNIQEPSHSGTSGSGTWDQAFNRINK